MVYLVEPRTRKSQMYLEKLTGKSLDRVIVVAEDRWDAIVKATEKWGAIGTLKMQEFFNACSVRKVSRRNEKEEYNVDDISKRKDVAASIVIDRVALMVGYVKPSAADGWELIVSALREIGSDEVAKAVVRDLSAVYGCSECAEYVEENYWGPSQEI